MHRRNNVGDLGSRTRDATHTPCIERQILNLRTTRAVSLSPVPERIPVPSTPGRGGRGTHWQGFWVQRAGAAVSPSLQSMRSPTADHRQGQGRPGSQWECLGEWGSLETLIFLWGPVTPPGLGEMGAARNLAERLHFQ